MTRRRQLVILLSFGTSFPLACAVWLLGLEGAANAAGLIASAVGVVTGLIGLRGVDPSPGSGSGSGPDDGEAGPRPAAEPATARRPRPWPAVVALTLGPLLIIGLTALAVEKVWRDPTGPQAGRSSTSSPGPAPASPGPAQSLTPDPSGSGTGGPVPSPAPTDGSVPTDNPPPPPTPRPTRRPTADPPPTGPVKKPANGQPWVPPAGTPEWTLHDLDGVKFLPRPVLMREVGSAELSFHLNMHQINWWQWTDSLDLSYEGCRRESAQRWDGLKLDDFTTPRTYCRREPDDPSKVSYVLFTAKDMAANPPYVKVRIWVYSP